MSWHGQEEAGSILPACIRFLHGRAWVSPMQKGFVPLEERDILQRIECPTRVYVYIHAYIGWHCNACREQLITEEGPREYLRRVQDRTELYSFTCFLPPQHFI